MGCSRKPSGACEKVRKKQWALHTNLSEGCEHRKQSLKDEKGVI